MDRNFIATAKTRTGTNSKPLSFSFTDKKMTVRNRHGIISVIKKKTSEVRITQNDKFRHSPAAN